MKLISAAAMRGLDSFAIETLKIPGARLMRRAACHVAEAVMERGTNARSAAVFCGAGNNGGDGIGAAAYLLRAGLSVRVFLIGDFNKLSPDSREMALLLYDYGGAIEIFGADSAAQYAETCDIIIDALFGIGLARDISGDAADAVDIINKSRAYVISADIPSGVNADTGEIHGVAVKADMTITFTAAKPGLFITPGAVYAGEIRVCDIGIPRELTIAQKSVVHTVGRGDITIPARDMDSHKYDYGSVLIVSGSVGYTGAPVMAAAAATLAGAGLVTLAVPRGIYEITAGKCLGEMVFPLSGNNRITESAWDEVRERAHKCDALLIGPGLQNTVATKKLVHTALVTCACPLILDADGINALAENIDVLDKAQPPVILTPHDGEFRRIAGECPAGGRLAWVADFAVAHGCVVILKGARTITAFPDGTAYINTSGNPGMAKGGSGDVLAGMLTALLGQGFALRDACLAAVYLHGLAGDIAASKLGEYSVTPQGILDMIPQAFLSVFE